ncbi:NACHT, LRR and PYD domains-containing protein 3-like isoform X1 [Alosa alosa]|uniref:NACHT, LRR and PYD domains-containing protein 3-like isoform X1 n=1 Tax=Alosa alosa TaxID=278164 RepID=UPI00201513DF|nr:NACHT, LRR and PYD domains-containing protein 3-like isoform X1 [Alosa alosa]
MHTILELIITCTYYTANLCVCIDQWGLSEGDVRTLTFLVSCCVNSVQQGASGTDEMQRDSLEHSLHFKPEDFEPNPLGVKRPALVKTAIPSIFTLPDDVDEQSGTSGTSSAIAFAWRWTPEEAEVHEKFRSTLKSTFQHLVEGISNQGESRLLQEIYTDLHITEGGGGVNDEHEVRQIERASWREAARGRSIECSNIFKPLLDDEQSESDDTSDECDEASDKSDHRQHKPIRTVLTKGVAGIGKTVSVQKFILDWTEGKNNQDVHFIFPLPFRELNLMKNKKLSLVKLIQHFFPEIKDSKIFTSSEHRVMFIFDGLDECRLPLDFHSKLSCCDVTEPVLVNVLLTNLIKRNLLPSALLWITTRPAAASQIPPECVDQVTEIRGFNDPQKEEYFRKRVCDENLANRTITHLKSSRSLYIMCHIPVFCWISATVVERTSFESENIEMPRTLTQMYTHFLIIQTSLKKAKYTERKETDEEIIFKLGKLAFQQLKEGNLIFYEEDLGECDIDVTEASVYSGVCTQIFREESGVYQGKVFSFVHLSIQEFLAALYVFLCFENRERSMTDQHQTSQLSALFRAATLHDLHKTAVDLALQSENGHLDLFLRFLLGLSLESNQNLLMHLLPQTISHKQSSEQTVQYIKQKIRDQSNSGRRINLFYCLNELNHHSVVEKIDRSSGTLFVDTLIPGEWETRRFTFKIPEEQLDEFDLQKYIKTPETDQTELLSPDEVLQRLVPVVTSALLYECSLTEKSCAAIASAARSNSCSLKELDLSHNDLHDAGVQHLSELLKLWNCSLTEKSCAAIASAARSNSCSLKELDLSHNELHDAGVQHLSELLKNPHCKLEKLVLVDCSLTEKSCAAIASAARSNSCSLKELNLSANELHDAGVQHLSELLKNPHCKLETLELSDCFLTEKSCAAIASAARSNSCSLKELNLNRNELHDAGVQHLSELLKNPHCKLEKLVVDVGIFLKESTAAAAASASSSHSDAAELHLRDKAQQNPGAELLSLDTHMEEHQCESCAEVPDSSHWVLVKPEVSTVDSVSTYSLSSPTGSYECPESGLRWTCAGPVTLQYHFIDWHLLADELPHMQYRPAGPSMDIKLISGELEEIHLPHFLCLGGSRSSLKDAVEVLHKQDSGVSIEKCDLSRFHARLVNPSFSLLGLFYSLKSFFFSGNKKESERPIETHADVLVYRSSMLPLTFRTYLLPVNLTLKKLVEDQEKSEEFSGVKLAMPRPVRPLQMNGFYSLKPDCKSRVYPVELNLIDCHFVPNFSVVRISKAVDFKMELHSSGDKQEVWQADILGTECWTKPQQDNVTTSTEVSESTTLISLFEAINIQTSVKQETVYQAEVQRTERLREPRQDNTHTVDEVEFLKDKMPDLIQRVTNVMPLADEMLSKNIIKTEQYNNIKAELTDQGKMRCLFDALRSCGTSEIKLLFKILLSQHSSLLRELGWD